MIQDQKTVSQYEKLSYFEKTEIIEWIEENFAEIPMLSETKKAGLKQLLADYYEFPAALVMIRYAMKALKLH